MEHRSEQARNNVYKNLRQVAPAFHSQVPLKTDPTLGEFTEFVTRFSRGQVGLRLLPSHAVTKNVEPAGGFQC
jgi:hypothetical protein